MIREESSDFIGEGDDGKEAPAADAGERGVTEGEEEIAGGTEELSEGEGEGAAEEGDRCCCWDMLKCFRPLRCRLKVFWSVLYTLHNPQ